MNKRHIRNALQRIEELQKEKDSGPPFFESRQKGYHRGQLGISFKSPDMIYAFDRLRESLGITHWFYMGLCSEQNAKVALELNEKKARRWIQQAKKILENGGGR